MAPKDSKDPSDASWLSRELFGLIFIFFGLLLILSLATFDPRDPWFNQVISGKVVKVYNKAGLFGSYAGGILFDMFGIAAWIAPLYFCLIGARRILGSSGWPWWRWAGIVLLCLCLAVAGGARDVQMHEMGGSTALGAVSNHGGGLLGFFLYSSLMKWLSSTGTLLLWVLSFLASIQLLVGFSWLRVVLKSATSLWQTCTTMAESVELPSKKPRIDGEHQEIPSHKLLADKEEDSLDIRFPPQAEKTESVLSRLQFWKKGNEKNVEEGVPLVLFDDEAIAEPEPDPLPYGDDEDVPPWLRDFEANHYGLPEQQDEEEPARAAFSGEEPVPAAAVTEPREQKQHLLQQEDIDAGEKANAFPQFVQEDISASPSEAPLGTPITPRQEVVKAEPEKMSPVKALFTRKAPLPLPSVDILEAIPVAKSATTRSSLEAKGKSVIACLNDFGIQCDLVGITPGPVVTMFEIRPAPGVRVSRIANLSDDLALALKAIAVRVQAPIPGTDTVGIEIPNEIRETVCFKELIQSTLFQKTPMKLPLALGKDIAGSAYVADLATMPHLLVAGATGAGKSVGINSILLSLLYKARPEEVKLLLVDPKRVEMAIYADLPHLVHPVVTEMSLAKNALDWAVAEMDKRYTDLARAGVRNITDYNTKMASFKGKVPDELIGLLPMPYLVVVIDELADLMLVGSKEVETSIVRLAQLARAAGIHLILATQRPSVDVVTGLIKANFPCRIAFQVTSKHDSRTILDATGAEYLLGKGDMLFKPAGGRFLRLHGAYVSDKNVVSVCDYWRSRQKPDYQVDFAEFGAAAAAGESGGGGDDVVSDPLYAEACEFVRQQGKVSISLIQRRFRIGFNKAARFVDQMEHDGIISPADGSKPRQVMR